MPVPLEEADRAIRLIDVTRLQLISNTFSDFLRLDASLDLRERAPNGLQGDLSIRGASYGQTLILLNGMRLNDVQSGHHNLDVPVPVESIERIEVLKGSGSTLYGSDAVGGVVNFITRRPEASEFRLRAAVGNFGINQQRASIGYTNARFSQQFSFTRDFSTGFRQNRDYRNLSLASDTHWRSRLGYTSVTLANNDRPFGADQFYGNFNSWERTRTWFGSVRQSLGENTQAAFAYRRHTDLFVLYRDRPWVFTNRHASEGWQGSLRRSDDGPANSKFHYGVEGYRDAVASNNLGRHDRSRLAAYGAVDIRALRRFSFTAGVREELHGSVNHQISPSVSGGFWLARQVKLRASVSRAFRLPTYTDLYYHDPANMGSPGLRPERAWNYEGGIDTYLGDRVRGTVTVFQRRERDGIDYVRRSPADIWRATNFQKLRFTGLEAAASYSPKPGDLVEASYTGLRGAQDAIPGVLSKYLFNYPIHSGVVSWQSVLKGGWLTRLRTGAVQRFARDPYAVVDVYLASNRRRVQPFVQFTNLTDTGYQEISGVAMPGRSFIAGVQIHVLSH